MKSLLLALAVLTSTGATAQYRVSADYESTHPIDEQFEREFTWETNLQNQEAVQRAEDAWRAELSRHYARLMEQLTASQQEILRRSQEAWEAAIAADRELLFSSHPNLRSAVGREGEVLTMREFMLRVRKRARDLEQYCMIFSSGSPTHIPETSETPSSIEARVSEDAPR